MQARSLLNWLLGWNLTRIARPLYRMNQMNVISNPMSSKWTDPSSSAPPPSGSSEEPRDCIGLEISRGSNEVGGNHSYTHVDIYSFIRRLIFSTCELRVWVDEWVGCSWHGEWWHTAGSDCGFSQLKELVQPEENLSKALLDTDHGKNNGKLF